MHDIWIGLIASATGQVRFIEEPLLMYRRHAENASPTLSKSRRVISKRIRERVVTSTHLLLRLLSRASREGPSK